MVSEECAAVERPNLGSISEPPPQNVDREGPSHHVVAHGVAMAPMAKTKQYHKGLYLAAPSLARRSSCLEPITEAGGNFCVACCGDRCFPPVIYF